MFILLIYLLCIEILDSNGYLKNIKFDALNSDIKIIWVFKKIRKFYRRNRRYFIFLFFSIILSLIITILRFYFIDLFNIINNSVIFLFFTLLGISPFILSNEKKLKREMEREKKEREKKEREIIDKQNRELEKGSTIG